MVRGRGEEPLHTTLRNVPGDADSSLALIVLVDDVAVHHAIVSDGPITIGRSPSCDVQIDHPSISRQHAVLHVGDGYTIEDKGSANGTQVRGVPLSPSQQVSIALGELVDLGATVLVLRKGGGDALVTHSTFEARLAEACEQARSDESEFCLFRLHCDVVAGASLVQRSLRSLATEGHVLARYGPGELELLVLGAGAAQGATIREHLQAALGAAQADLRIGLACYPANGRAADALMFVANRGARAPGKSAQGERSPIVADPAMEELYAMVDRVAQGTISVLLLGETGVGKEVVARAVHSSSPRREGPFVAINCGAISDALLESELFGHEKGAFTGATASKRGLLESANGGTVFLDEIGELPSALQVKLLRTLEERQVRPVGGLKPRHFDVRFVAATNRDLEEEARHGRFREDLLYRLNGVTLRIPPLRERLGEITVMATAFAEAAASSLNRPTPALSDEALTLLQRHSWPRTMSRS